jgi:aldehyde:ferredoxin oxidoreductase|tara:strand:+ start:4574 stop:5014 length:441 start_codon:yes stop_codon:yes gene_type:complete
MSYQGRYTIKRPEKYAGDAKKVVYRSLWERQAFKWCENNPNVKMWNSEEVVVPYKSTVDKKLHRYFVDLLIQMNDKSTYLVEIKPKKETKPPKKPKRQTKRYINEQLTFIKNQDKWEAAAEFAEHKGWKFQVWTEETLKNLGIKIL